MVTKTWALLLIFLTTLLTTLAQFFLKTALQGTVAPVPLVTGLILYGLGALLMILAFKGGDVSLLYPIIATSYIWVALISQFWFHETVSALRWIGIAFILLGVVLLGLSGKNVPLEVL
ncbi:MAG TPA: EamA family transporter [Candidatus Binatia bacterium]|nr:EamA family transporter [Candidatus Binatia bacterium]